MFAETHTNSIIGRRRHYHTFGSQMPGRAYISSSGAYRYGFNGKENDDEVKGDGNQQDYGMRIYDPRLGKFLSIDPLTRKYPMLTPYQFASNSPIICIDIDGLEGIPNPLTYLFGQMGITTSSAKDIENKTV
ncbi:MAG: RHS repeat domain-containing protein, partial [Bacteroidia bacterium]